MATPKTPKAPKAPKENTDKGAPKENAAQASEAKPKEWPKEPEDKKTAFGKYEKCIFVDAASKEWPAKIIPLPLNKATIVRQIDHAGFEDAMRKAVALPAAKRAEAMKALADSGKEIILLVDNASGESEEVFEVDGKYMKTTVFKGRKIPCADLLIDFGDPERGRHNWSMKRSVPHVNYVPMQNDKSARQVIHFK